MLKEKDHLRRPFATLSGRNARLQPFVATCAGGCGGPERGISRGAEMRFSLAVIVFMLFGGTTRGGGS